MKMNIRRDTFDHHRHYKMTSWLHVCWLHQHQSHVTDDSSSSSSSDAYLLILALVGEWGISTIISLKWAPKSWAGHSEILWSLCGIRCATFGRSCTMSIQAMELSRHRRNPTGFPSKWWFLQLVLPIVIDLNGEMCYLRHTRAASDFWDCILALQRSRSLTLTTPYRPTYSG